MPDVEPDVEAPSDAREAALHRIPSGHSYMDDLRFGSQLSLEATDSWSWNPFARSSSQRVLTPGSSTREPAALKRTLSSSSAATGGPESMRGSRHGTGAASLTLQAAAQEAIRPRPIKSAQQEAFEPVLGASLTASIVGAMLIAVLLAASMYVPLEQQSAKVRTTLCTSCHDQLMKQRELIAHLVQDESMRLTQEGVLTGIIDMVKTYVTEPANGAVDNMADMMTTNSKLGLSTTPPSDEGRKALQYNAWVSIYQQWRNPRSARLEGDTILERTEDASARPHAEQLYVAFENGDFAGMRLKLSSRCGYSSTSADVEGQSSFGTFDATSVCKAEYMDLGNGSAGNRWRHIYQLDECTGDRDLQEPYYVHPRYHGYEATSRPYYLVQERILNMSQESQWGPAFVPARREWTGLYIFTNGAIGVSLTAPLAPCGDYSCFEGVIGADITLPKITHDCNRFWHGLKRRLESDRMQISPENSSIFILTQISRTHPEQEGVLLAASNSNETLGGSDSLVFAEESSQQIVSITAKALFKKCNHSLSEDTHFLQMRHTWTFRRSKIMQDVPELEKCETRDFMHEDFSSGDCLQVMTQHIQMDNNTWWLVVSVLPLGAFAQDAIVTANLVDGRHDETLEIGLAMWHRTRRVEGTVFIGVTLLSVCMGLFLNHYLVPSLRRLSKQMALLLNLDFRRTRQELHSGKTCRISDVAKLQSALFRLSHGIEAFSRFVPEPVVRNIVRGEDRATRLHVSEREVSIMFTNICNFAMIAEGLAERDVLFLLTSYFNVMTNVIGHYDGVISEVLTDGFLVFWNTPQADEDHAAKALTTALELERTMAHLNAELIRIGFPSLSIFTGVHTGTTLSGNLGSDVKMKFGCLGDPVNIASRIQGLCSYYDAGVICSAATRNALPNPDAFAFRKLDLVKVKGKRNSITVFEVIERQNDGIGPTSRQDQALMYEQALAAFQHADFEQAHRLAVAVVDENPDDTAAAHLRDRANLHGGLDGQSPGLSQEERESWTGVLLRGESK